MPKIKNQIRSLILLMALLGFHSLSVAQSITFEQLNSLGDISLKQAENYCVKKGFISFFDDRNCQIVMKNTKTNEHILLFFTHGIFPNCKPRNVIYYCNTPEWVSSMAKSYKERPDIKTTDDRGKIAYYLDGKGNEKRLLSSSFEKDKHMVGFEYSCRLAIVFVY